MLFTSSYLTFALLLDFMLVANAAADFRIEFRWSHINYTWQSRAQYLEAVKTGKYIPENIFPTGLKLHGDRVYLATPKYRNGVPLTLSHIPRNAKNKTNLPLVPFPGWDFHIEGNCSTLQNVQSMEIDTKGFMWVLDGVRFTNSTISCPPKLLQFDLNKGGFLNHTYIFPNEVSLQDGAFLNDIVIDEMESGDFAYITDASNIDPGLIVYSRSQNRAWKLRDGSMFPGRESPKYSIDKHPMNVIGAINGIALTPVSSSKQKRGRTVFYSALTGYGLFSIPSGVIRDEKLYKNGNWRKSVHYEDKKQGSTDGMVMDNKNNLFYSITSLNAIGIWNIHESLDSESKILYENNKTMVWPDAFGMDQDGNLYVVSNHAINYLDTNVKLNFSAEIKFRIFKYHTGTKSYLYQ